MEDNFLLSWLKKNRPTVVTPTAAAMRDEQMGQLVHHVNSKLIDIFNRKMAILHFDGQCMIQKEKSHSQHATSFQQNHCHAIEAIAHAHSHIKEQELRGPTFMTDINGIHCNYNMAILAWKKEKALGSAIKLSLATTLSTVYGWTVHLCQYEPDCPGHNATPQESTSQLQQQIQIFCFCLLTPSYTKMHIIVVSGNDFAHNIFGFSLENNLNILKSFPNTQSQSTGELLEQYSQIMEGKNNVTNTP
ncbi:hypothetical protein BG006_001053 [Podila minutissima]|uniref:Uncharacterized protein n=1 Tax=Podila minutissima TaxID=64525 RepID=A0A9P5ST14_9FUNG|nr:hypothetical protein BG006_001053 [Podila minutissima]